jgi:hypothetical protein
MQPKIKNEVIYSLYTEYQLLYSINLMFQAPISKQNTSLCSWEHPDDKHTCSGRSFLSCLGVLLLMVSFLRGCTSTFMGPNLSEEKHTLLESTENCKADTKGKITRHRIIGITWCSIQGHAWRRGTRQAQHRPSATRRPRHWHPLASQTCWAVHQQDQKAWFLKRHGTLLMPSNWLRCPAMPLHQQPVPWASQLRWEDNTDQLFLFCNQQPRAVLLLVPDQSSEIVIKNDHMVEDR